MAKWTAEDIPDLTGRRFIVTGANAGIGLETVRGLADAGATVTMACRSVERAEAAAKDLSGDIDIAQLDLSDLDNVKQFAKGRKTDVLINNAGVMVPPFGRTKQGFEMQWGTNVVGHFALTGLMLPRISQRVVNVSSIAHRKGRIDFHNMRGEKPYAAWREYQQSKLGNLMFGLELSERWDKVATAAHPGVTATNLAQHMSLASKIGFALMQKSWQGALPTLHAATVADDGDYIGPSGLREIRGYPSDARIKAHALDRKVRNRLWTTLEEQSGVAYLSEAKHQ